MLESIFPPDFVEPFSFEEVTPENWLVALVLFNYETLTVEIPPLDLNFFYDPRDEMEASETENVTPPDSEGQESSEENDPLNTAVDYGSDGEEY